VRVIGPSKDSSNTDEISELQRVPEAALGKKILQNILKSETHRHRANA
jgi:hypothetical protein